ncbi:alpha-D-xyloside xylohydrolase [Salana multivorans]|uniref:alpha-D-xyloside xylohydrolase n=1 Tax=Salana multivorans TaxID=120377 RepID=A0A3N2DAC3_9MICO|nr:alpha-xylosidase [Salana multivorans]ROR96741.1 alpha-D-xyloside xylohydrolase [Salana multivorans]
MKFSDGYWLTPEGMTILRAAEVRDVVADPDAGTLTVYASTQVIRARRDTLNRPLLTVTFSSPAPGVVRTRIVHFDGGPEQLPRFELAGEPGFAPTVRADEAGGELTTGELRVVVRRGPGWHVEYRSRAGAEDAGVGGTGAGDGSVDRLLTSSTTRSAAAIARDDGAHYMHEQLTLAPGELIYGLGERFGPVVKNGQSVDIWNLDGGTMSEQAYKNVPFLLSSRGYGVLVDHPGKVSYEIGSEAVERTQFSVPGQVLEYLVIDGPTPKDVLARYTALSGRPARVPAWSYGLWLTTSFTTSYDEETVTSFVDGMAEREIPLSVFHFDCFWMREFHWTDFVWDPATFPDPAGMLRRMKAKGLRICVWINPYIAQRSRLFAEGRERGYLVRNADGSIWQTDLWQAGMALVDFTNPEAGAWYAGYLRELLDQGVDCFKTDFGERIPSEGVVYHDGGDPERMHNYYTHLYNRTVWDALVEARGEGEAVLFARSATAGGQQFPVHWGGDNDSSLASMAETLRGGLSLGLSGFGFWSHDIGGFEGTPDPLVFKRWLPFGLLSSHSRLHGSDSVRVPWAFDEEAVELTRRYTHLKHRLMPYLALAGDEAHAAGVPVLRHTLLEFPDDRSCYTAELQFLLGPSVLVAPVFDPDGSVDVYLPEGRWTSLLTGEVADGGRWRRERHDVGTLPVYVRPGTVLPLGARADRPDYEWVDGVTLTAYELADGQSVDVHVPRLGGALGDGRDFTVRREGSRLVATGPDDVAWRLALPGGDGRAVDAAGGCAEVSLG